MDVRPDVRVILIVRSLLYCVSLIMFVYSLERLNPVSALLALHSGAMGITTIIRALMNENMFFTLTVLKGS